jgi:Ca-activated chloride channel family protein
MFARPEYAWLLAAVPLAGLGLILEARRRRALVGGDAAGRVRHRLHAGCFLAGLFLVGLAGAGPQLGLEAPGPAGGPGRLVVALDCSRSMLARDLAPTRLDAAKALVRDVLARLPQLPAGLVIFAGRARLACPVTQDRTALLAFLDAVGPADAPLGGTDRATALEAARLALLGAEPGVVLLVSDGEDTVTAPDVASGQGPPVVTVAVGGTLPATVPDATGVLLRDGTGAPVQVGVDVAALADLADRRGGAAFRLSPDGASPGAAVAEALARLVPTRADDRNLPARPADRTGPCLLAGFALLAVDLLVVPLRLARFGALLLLVLALGRASPALAGSSAAEKVARGLAALERGQNDQARDAFLAARARDPDGPAILFDLGTAYYRLGRFDLAQDAFDRAARASLGRLRAAALYNQGNAAFRRGDSEVAVALYQAALAEDPADADARANLQFARSHPPSPSPEHASLPDEPRDATGPGDAPSPDSQGVGRDGQAPPAAGPDQGQGPSETPSPGAPVATTPQAVGQPGPDTAVVPLAGKEGVTGGPKRTTPDDKAIETRLDRVPDLPGLPLLNPGYVRPTVEKDW